MLKKLTALVLMITAAAALFAAPFELTELRNFAAGNDEKLMLLQKQWLLNQARNELADHRRGLEISAGTGGAGITASATDKGIKLSASPTAELRLPETVGTVIKTELPLQYTASSGGLDSSLKLSLKQDLNELFDLKQQDTAKYAARDAAELRLLQQINSRYAELEKEILTLIREVFTLRKKSISSETEYYEKQTSLEHQLRSGMILENGSLHLSKLLEIQKLRSSIDETGRNYLVCSEKLKKLAGVNADDLIELPFHPMPDRPQPDSSAFGTILTAEADRRTRSAELADLNADYTPKLNLELTASQQLKTGGEPSASASISSGFENFSLKFSGGWNKKDGGSISAAVQLIPVDTGRKEIRNEIAELKLSESELQLASAERSVRDNLDKINDECNRIVTAEKNIRFSKDFIDRYLNEMEDKYSRGLIPEIEIMKARDQKKVNDLENEILNIDRYLLQNSIDSITDRNKL